MATARERVIAGAVLAAGAVTAAAIVRDGRRRAVDRLVGLKVREWVREALGSTEALDRPVEAPQERRCVVCGCTDNEACLTAAGPCYWFLPNVCSGCMRDADPDGGDLA